MKTVIEFDDGSTEEHPDTMPAFDGEGAHSVMCLMTPNSVCTTQDFPITHVKRVIWENTEKDI